MPPKKSNIKSNKQSSSKQGPSKSKSANQESKKVLPKSLKSIKMLLDLSDDRLPDFLHFEILLRMDAKHLIQDCTVVSKKWHSILSQNQFWIQKCEYDGRLDALPPVSLRQLPFDFKKICIRRPFDRNLIQPYSKTLKDPEDFCKCENPPPGTYGCSLKNLGGDTGWVYQRKNGFSHEIPPVHLSGNQHFDQDFDFNLIDSCLATSYFWSSKEIMIDLLKEGFDEYVLDVLRPTISVSEYCGNRADCGAIYHIEVYLLNKNKQLFKKKKNSDLAPELVTKFEKTHVFNQWETQKWIKIEHDFKEYPPGVRYILFKSDGKDRQGWRGHYGSKHALPSVVVTYDFNNLPVDVAKAAQDSKQVHNVQEGAGPSKDVDMKEISDQGPEGPEDPNGPQGPEGPEGPEAHDEDDDGFGPPDPLADLPHNLWNDAAPESVLLQTTRRQFNRRRGRGGVRRTLRNIVGRMDR